MTRNIFLISIPLCSAGLVLCLTIIPFAARDLQDAGPSTEMSFISCLNQVQDNLCTALTVKLTAAMFMHGFHPFSCAEDGTWILFDSYAVLSPLTREEVERS